MPPRKEKRTQKCTLCGEPGHNCTTCPHKQPAQRDVQESAQEDAAPARGAPLCRECSQPGYSAATCRKLASHEPLHQDEADTYHRKCSRCGIRAHNKRTCRELVGPDGKEIVDEDPVVESGVTRCALCGATEHGNADCALREGKTALEIREAIIARQEADIKQGITCNLYECWPLHRHVPEQTTRGSCCGRGCWRGGRHGRGVPAAVQRVHAAGSPLCGLSPAVGPRRGINGGKREHAQQHAQPGSARACEQRAIHSRGGEQTTSMVLSIVAPSRCIDITCHTTAE